MTFSSLALVASVGLLAVLAFDLRLEKSFLSHKSRKEVIDIPNPCERFSSSEHWITIQRRLDGRENFYRNWTDYEDGFGSFYGEFWIGLKNLHWLSSSVRSKLMIVLQDHNGAFSCAVYDSFVVDSPVNNYTLWVSGYSGNAGDSLTFHNGQAFSTYDNDNDDDIFNCASKYQGAWWYRDCHTSNLNGKYLKGSTFGHGMGIIWQNWKGSSYSLKSVEMMVAAVNDPPKPDEKEKKEKEEKNATTASVVKKTSTTTQRPTTEKRQFLFGHSVTRRKKVLWQ